MIKIAIPRHPLAWAATALLLITALTSGCRKKKSEIHPQYLPLVEAVYASGHLVPLNEYQLFSQADGYLVEQYVHEGDTVRAGQPLLRINSETQDVKLNTASEALNIARLNASPSSPILQELRLMVSNARAKMQLDSTNYIRQKNLHDQNIGTKVEYDRMVLAYQSSRNDYKAALERLERTQSQLRLELQNALGQYNLLQTEKGFYTLTSSIPGRVYELYKEPGELVRRAEPVARIGSSDSVYLELRVDELDISRVKLGQEILVKLDVDKTKVYRARVTKVYPMLNVQDQSFRVDAEFTEPIPKALAGLTVEANIIVNSRPRTLTIPREYLKKGDSVTVRIDGKKKTIPIKKGAENFELVEVISGLDTTSVLIKD